ncbi:MAG: hypothetical protein R3A79_05620 [Nannocystaceae bacterium]
MRDVLCRALVGLSVAAAGCFSDPLAETGLSAAATVAASTGDGSSSTADAAATTSSTGATTTTTAATTDASASASSTTAVGSASTTDASTSDATTSDATTSDATTTGGSSDLLVLHPTIAACVFLAGNGAPYGAPLECTNAATTANATAATGVVTIDSAASYSLGREAQLFLRFDVPPEVGDQRVAGVTLRLRVADSANAGGPAGRLHLAAAFSTQSLLASNPALLDVIATNLAVLGANETGAWELPSSLLSPGQPLHLGLRALADDGVLYLGAPADVSSAPSLTIELQ